MRGLLLLEIGLTALAAIAVNLGAVIGFADKADYLNSALLLVPVNVYYIGLLVIGKVLER
jgi:hypothetical protein